MNQTPINHFQKPREMKKYDPLPETEKDAPNDYLKRKTPSDEILLSHESISHQGFELEAQTNLHQKGDCLRSKTRLFWASYCEITEAASLLRKKWMILLSVFICSMKALEMEETEKLIPVLFSVSYICLSLQVVEDLVRFCYLKTASSGTQRMECVFGMTSKTIIMLFILNFNLQYSRTISPIFMLLSPILSLVEILMYLRNHLIAESQENDMKIIMRGFYMLQSFIIAAKINNLVDFGWKGTLAPLWIYLLTHALYALIAGLLLLAVSLAAIINMDIQTLRFLKSRILGFIWYISYHGLGVVGLVILIGIFEKVEDSDQDEIMQNGILWAKKLSSFLLIYSAILFPILKRFNTSSSFVGLRTTLQNQVVSRKKYTLLKIEEDQKKTAFFSMVSQTYFSLLTEKKSGDFPIEEEESLCYICESNISNAILAKCGHGGVCFDCAIRSIEQKNECMGCRKPGKAIFRIDSYSRNEAEIIVQASEIVKIIERI